MELTTYTNVLRSSLEKWGQRGLWRILGAGLGGFALSAASLGNRAMPIALGLLCAAPPGPYAVAIALGAAPGTGPSGGKARGQCGWAWGCWRWPWQETSRWRSSKSF